jgi:hypothetical protein
MVKYIGWFGCTELTDQDRSYCSMIKPFLLRTTQPLYDTHSSITILMNIEKFCNLYYYSMRQVSMYSERSILDNNADVML